MERPPYEIALMRDHILRLEEELKAKEQECEEWQKIVEIFRIKLDTSTIKRMNLEAERNYCYYALKNITKGKIDSCCCAEEYAQKVLKAEKMAVQNLEYNKGLKAIKTLAEIKKLVEKSREDLYTCESIGYADDDLRSILQKINEV
jgi:hypothetical protein